MIRGELDESNIQWWIKKTALVKAMTLEHLSGTVQVKQRWMSEENKFNKSFMIKGYMLIKKLGDMIMLIWAIKAHVYIESLDNSFKRSHFSGW